MTDLGTLGGSSIAWAINNNGQIVGAFSRNGSDRAFIYENGSMFDLNTLLPANFGWTLQDAYGINDLGQIIAYGISPNGTYQGFLLSPVPIPECGTVSAGIFACLCLLSGIVWNKTSLDAKIAVVDPN